MTKTSDQSSPGSFTWRKRVFHLHSSYTGYIFDVMALAASRHLAERLAFTHCKKLLFKTFKALKC